MAERSTYLSQEYLRVRRGGVVFGNVLYHPNGTCGPRIQHDYQLVVVHSGHLQLTLDQEIIQVPESYGILLSPGHQELFSFATNSETFHSWCAIEPRAVPVALRRRFQKLRGPIPFLGKMAALLDMGKMSPLRSNDQDQELDNAFYLGLALALMSEFAAVVRGGRIVSTSNDSVLSRLDQVIATQFAQQLSLDDIAAASGVSRQHLLKICRLSGMPTPMQQLYNKRLQTAADLLLHTGLSVGEIADRCGFVNMFHFSRRFKQAHRRSPKIWRNALWKATDRR